MHTHYPIVKISMRIKSIALLVCWSVALDAADPAGFIPDRYIGYWQDGSGVVRDATPVTTWRDFPYKQVMVKSRHGKEIKVTRPDRSVTDQSENIVWQVPYYNYCSGGMILVGGKLFGLTDRAGLGFNVDRVADFIGAPLTCFDPATGKELWKVDLHHWDLVPKGEELIEILKEYNKQHPGIYGAYYALGGALGTKGKTKLTQDTYVPLRDAFNAVAEKPAPDTLEEVLKTNIKPRGYIQTSFDGRVCPEYFPSQKARRERLQKKGGYLKDPWFGQMAHLGLNMQTPVSDGKHIFVSTSFGAVFCVDLDGNIIWKHWFGAGWDRGWAIASPVLVGDTLVVHGVDPNKAAKRAGHHLRVAMNKKDGSIIWSQGDISYKGYQPAPIVLSLPVAGNDSDRMDVLLCGDGDVLRVEDGKRIATGLGGGGHARPWAVEGTTIALINGVADGGAFRGKTKFDDHLKKLIVIDVSAPSRDEVTATLLWHDKSCTSYSNGLIFKDGRLHWFDGKKQELFIKDARTGKALASCKAKRIAGGRVRAFHTPIIAGRYYLALDQGGSCGVFDLGEDGVTPSNSAINLMASSTTKFLGGKFNYGAIPLVSGNRIFLRSNEQLYCIGDPQAEMQLSKVHN